jgi:hypothetical protein
MSSNDVIGSVRARLARETELRERGGVGAEHRAQMERHEAWRELWQAAYLGTGDADLRREFCRLFPESPELRRHLEGTICQLRGADRSAAQEAAKLLERLSHRSLTMQLEAEVGDPRLVLQVCDVLVQGVAERSDLDAATVVSLVRYLRAVAFRMSYGRSPQVFDALERVWAASPALRAEAATAMCHLDDVRKWVRVTATLEARLSFREQALLATALAFAGVPPNDEIPRLTAAMLSWLEKSRRPQDWVVALGRCAGPEAVEALEKLRGKRASSATLENIDGAIAEIRRRFGR